MGETPKLKSGFAALYRALGLPVVPVATDSGRVWGRGFSHQGGTITLKSGKLSRRASSAMKWNGASMHSINALELAPQARA